MPEIPTYSLTLEMEIPITNMVRENKQTGHVMINYGNIYGFVHEIAYEEIRKRGLPAFFKHPPP